MRLSIKEKRICRKYSTIDREGFVHCRECPLVIDRRYALCKATATKEEYKEYMKEKEMKNGQF